MPSKKLTKIKKLKDAVAKVTKGVETSSTKERLAAGAVAASIAAGTAAASYSAIKGKAKVKPKAKAQTGSKQAAAIKAKPAAKSKAKSAAANIPDIGRRSLTTALHLWPELGLPISRRAIGRSLLVELKSMPYRR